MKLRLICLFLPSRRTTSAVVSGIFLIILTDSVFAIVLYVGLICHSLLSEVLLRAPALVQSNENYVKKVVFPL